MTSAEISKRINKSFSRLRLKIFFLSAASIILSGILLYEFTGTPLASTYANTIASIDTYKGDLLKNLLYIYSSIAVLLLFGIVIMCRTSSHRVAGPMKRFEDMSKMLAAGDYHINFDVRKTDRIQELAAVMNEIRNTYENKQSRLDKEFEELHTRILEFEKFVIACDTVHVEQGIQDLRSISEKIDGIFSELRL